MLNQKNDQKENRIQNRIHLNVDLHPTTCNICGGEVEYVPNELIYGKPYGSGFSYLCTECGAHVGTEKDNPTQALGILANKYLRTSKGMTHNAIDPLWQEAGATKKEKRKARIRVYHDLADRIGIDHRSCHIGFFDLPLLRRAYAAIMQMRAESGLSPKPFGTVSIKTV